MRIPTVLAALLLLAPAADAAQDRPRLEKLAAKLGLTGAQKEQMRAVKARHADGVQRLRDDVRAARTELQRVLDATPADAAAVRAASQRLETARSELAVARGARRADVSAALTPDQQRLAQQLRDGHRARKTEKRAAREERRAERRGRKSAGNPPR
jgi:Spy/CpxP family protein refolding chaperone